MTILRASSSLNITACRFNEAGAVHPFGRVTSGDGDDEMHVLAGDNVLWITLTPITWCPDSRTLFVCDGIVMVMVRMEKAALCIHAKNKVTLLNLESRFWRQIMTFLCPISQWYAVHDDVTPWHRSGGILCHPQVSLI